VANATDVLQPSRLIVLSLSPPPVWTFPRLPPGTPTSTTTQEILVAEGGTMWARILTGNFAWNCDFHANSGIFYMPQICDMGPTALLPFRRKACWGFFRPEKSWLLRPGLNPRTWVLKGSTLPLDHWSRKYEDYNHLFVCCFDGDDADNEDPWLPIAELCRSQSDHTTEYL